MTEPQGDWAEGSHGDGMAPQSVEISQLIADHHAPLYRYAYRLCGSEADAEDLTQQAFLLAHQRLDQLRDSAKADRWLYVILRSCFLKSLRRRRPVDAGSLELDVADIPEDCDEETVDRELLELALAQLPDEHRMVLLMFYFEQASYREIASQLEIPIGTVMSKLHRAKRKLRAVLLARDDQQAAQDHDSAVTH